MNSHSIRFGLLAGTGTVALLLTAYFIDKPLQLSPSVVWSTTILYVIGMTMAAIENRNENGGFISFKEALKAAFIVWVIANAMYHIFNYLHFNYFDPGMLAIQKEQFLEQLSENAGMFSEDMVETMAERAEEMTYGLAETISGYVMSLIGGFILSAIIARLVRRENFAA